MKPGPIHPHTGLFLAATNVWFLPTQQHLTDSIEGNYLLCKAIKADENDDFVLSSSSFFPWALPTWPPHNIILLSCSFEYDWRNPLAEEESASSRLTSTFSPSSLALAHSTPLRCPSADWANKSTFVSSIWRLYFVVKICSHQHSYFINCKNNRLQFMK